MPFETRIFRDDIYIVRSLCGNIFTRKVLLYTLLGVEALNDQLDRLDGVQPPPCHTVPLRPKESRKLIYNETKLISDARMRQS